MEQHPGRIVFGLLLVVLVAVVAAGPFGMAGRTPDRPSGPSAAFAPSGRPALTPSPTASATAGATPDPTATPTAPAPVAIADIAIVPVTDFRATSTSTDRAEVRAVLAGTNSRYAAVELLASEADAILAALDVARPADATRLILAPDRATLAADLAAGKRLGFMRADAVGPEVRALAWRDAALFGGERVRDLADWPLTARLPAPATADAFDPATLWTLFAGGDIMLDRGVYETLAVKGKGADFPFDGGTAEITGRCKDCSPLGWDTPYIRRTGNAGAFRDLIKGADIAIANFENPAPDDFTWHTSKTVFSADPRLVSGLADAGIDYVSLANNHIRDFGGQGVLETIRNVTRHGIEVSGAGKNLAAARRPAVLDAAGTKVAILGYDAIAGGYHATATRIGSAPLTAKVVREDVAAAREAGADVVIVFPHWGTEYDPTPFAN